MNCQSHSTPPSPSVLTIVVPVFNEVEVLPVFHRRLCAALANIQLFPEIIYVDDGSTDDTRTVLQSLHSTDDRVAIIALSRNFGKELAMTAGLDYARGDAVIVIDADLQDPPELIPEFIRYWHQGYDVVFGQRTSRLGETLLKRSTSYLFYRLIRRLSRVKIPQDTGDFRLLSRRAVEALRKLREQHRFMKGLFAWIGYAQKAVEYQRAPRQGGRTKWNYMRLWNFAVEGITSFSTAPLKVATYLGLLTSLFAFVFGASILVRTLLYGDPVRGYPSLMVVILFLGGAQLISVGLLGEYLARVFDEVKNRPLYLIEQHFPSTARDRVKTSSDDSSALRRH